MSWAAISTLAGRTGVVLLVAGFLLAAVAACMRYAPFVTVVARVDHVSLSLSEDARVDLLPLLRDDLLVRAAEWSDVRAGEHPECAPATAASERRIRLEFDEGVPLELFAERPLDLDLVWGGPGRVSLLFPAPTDAARHTFRSEVYPVPGLRIRLAALGLPQSWCSLLHDGGAGLDEGRRATLAPLELEPSGPRPRVDLLVTQPSPSVRVYSPTPDGGASSFAVPSTAEMVVAGNRILFVDRTPDRAEVLENREPLLARSIAFWDDAGPDDRPVSYLLSGRIEFGDRELRPIDLDAGAFLSIATRHGEAFVLRSLALLPDGLEVTLAGEAALLQLGPSPGYNNDERPTWLRWLFAQDEWRWSIASIGGALVTLVASWLAGEGARGPAGRPAGVGATDAIDSDREP